MVNTEPKHGKNKGKFTIPALFKFELWIVNKTKVQSKTRPNAI